MEHYVKGWIFPEKFVDRHMYMLERNTPDEGAQDCSLMLLPSTMQGNLLARLRSAHNSTMPSTITCVASSAPFTSGMPNSRATIAACDIGPPTSVTAALAMLKRGVQIGVVVWATSTSPDWKR